MSQTNAHCEKEILVAHLLNTSSGVIHVTETSLDFLREKILMSLHAEEDKQNNFERRQKRPS